MKHKYFFLFLFIFLANYNLVKGQDNIWDIYTFDNQPYSKVVLDRLNGDTLYVKAMGNKHKILLASIKKMKKQRSAKIIGLFTFSGTVIGLLSMHLRNANLDRIKIDYYLRNHIKNNNFILGAISGGLVGYLFGSFARPRFYDISELSIEKRKRILRQIILRNLHKH